MRKFNNENHFEKWWTGKAPIPGQCPGVNSDGFISSLPQFRFHPFSRQSLLDYFDNTWTLTEVLFTALQCEEAFYEPAYHQLRHPLIFYYAHPAVLYVNKLRVAGLLDQPINPHFENIFEVGVDEMSWDDMSKNKMNWPALADVIEYRRQVYSVIKNLILNHNVFDQHIHQKSKAWSLVMGLEHERIHLETSSVLMRELPVEYLRKPKEWLPLFLSEKPLTAAQFVRVPETQVRIGKPDDFPTFGWDNEYGEKTETVPAFEASSLLISNAQMLEFTIDGGYREPQFWTEEGWSWRKFRNTKAPCFWIPDGPAGLHKYKLRTTFEVTAFQPSWPAIVNFHEALAYCKWRSFKDSSGAAVQLLSEVQQNSLRQFANETDSWNLNLKFGSETAVHSHMNHSGQFGDIYGNVWQWSQDSFSPLSGFQVHPYYEDFSTPCFDNRHQMIFGGSFASTGDEASRFARFHFRPHFFQHAGFRIARTVKERVSVSASDRPRAVPSDKELVGYKDQFSRGQGLIHLNNAGLSPITRAARDCISHWSQRFFDEGMHCNDSYLAAVDQARETLAKFLNCKSGEIAYFQSTAGAISQVAFSVKLNPGDEVLMWDQEYASNLYPWKAAVDLAGAKLNLVQSGPELQTDVQRLIDAVTARTRVIAISWVQFQTGALTELEPLAQFTQKNGILLVVDAIQGLGLMPFDFLKLGVDAVCGGSHKWLASPVGVGFLAIREELARKLAPRTIGANTYGTCDDPTDLTCLPKLDALKFEAGSKQVLEILAMEASIKQIMRVGTAQILKESERLAQRLQKGLIELGMKVHNPHGGRQRGAIVTFEADSWVEQVLRQKKISFAKRGPGLRLSPSAFNSDSDIDFVIDQLKDGQRVNHG